MASRNGFALLAAPRRHNYSYLCTNDGSAAPLVVFNCRARAHIRYPVTFPCSDTLHKALVSWLSESESEQQHLLGACSASDLRSAVQAAFRASDALSRIRTSYACSALMNSRSVDEVAHLLGFSTAHVDRLSQNDCV